MPARILDFLRVNDDDREDDVNDWHLWHHTYQFFASRSRRHRGPAWLDLALKIAQLDVNVLTIKGKMSKGQFRTTTKAKTIRAHLTSKLSVFLVMVEDETQLFWTSAGLPSIYTNEFFDDADHLTETSMHEFWLKTLKISRIAYIPNVTYRLAPKFGEPWLDATSVFNRVLFLAVWRNWDELVQAGRIGENGVREDPSHIKIKVERGKIQGTPVGHPWRLLGDYGSADLLRFANIFAKRYVIEYVKSL